MATLHPHLQDFLRLAYGCMACDGEIAVSELSCLRSIAVQMGKPSAEVASSLSTIRNEFETDAADMVNAAKRRLAELELSIDESITLMDLLVQLVEADGKIHPSEHQYVRDVVATLNLDRKTLRKAHPEWREYLAEGFRSSDFESSPYLDAILSHAGIIQLPSSDDS